VSVVASVEVQLSVEESPLLMEVGLACSETDGFAAGGGGGGGGGGAAAGFFAQPATKARARTAVRMAPRYKELETRIIRILLSVKNSLLVPPSANILSLAGWVKANTSHHDMLYIAHTRFLPKISKKQCCAPRIRKKTATKTSDARRRPQVSQCFASDNFLPGRPIGRLVVAGGGELAGLGAIGEHGPDLPSASARGFKNDVAAIGSPAGAFIART
jgi:hypothetical protein